MVKKSYVKNKNACGGRKKKPFAAKKSEPASAFTHNQTHNSASHEKTNTYYSNRP